MATSSMQQIIELRVLVGNTTFQFSLQPSLFSIVSRDLQQVLGIENGV